MRGGRGVRIVLLSEGVELRQVGRIGAAWPDGERERVWRSVERVLGDAAFAPIFAPGSRAEVAIMGTVTVGGAPRAVSGKIDRLAVTDDAVLVVDFKTNRPPPRDAASVPPSHVAQMALYGALLRPLYPGRDIRAALVYTEAALLIPLGGDALARALDGLGLPDSRRRDTTGA